MLNPCQPLSFLVPRGYYPEKPLFIFLPGMDGTGELLDAQLLSLGDRFDVRCLIIPGDDLSPWEELVHQVLHLLDHDPNRGPAYLCGESFGACLALQLIARADERFSHLILINPASSYHRLPWFGWVSDFTHWLAPSIYRAATMSVLPLLAALHRITPDNRLALLRAMGSVSQASAAWRLNLLSQFRPETLNLQSLRQPTLLVAAQNDRLLPSQEEVQRLAQFLPHSQIQTLPHSGHICLLEDGVNLGELLAAVDFLPRSSSLASS